MEKTTPNFQIKRSNVAIGIGLCAAVVGAIAVKLGASIDMTGALVASAWIWSSEWLRGRLWLLRAPLRKIVIEAQKPNGPFRQPATIISKSLTAGGVLIFLTSLFVTYQ